MPANRREKERLRQARLAKRRAIGQASAQRRRRRTLIGVGTQLILGVVAVAIVGSSASSSRPTPTAVASTRAPTDARPASRASSGAREELVANTREANQVLGSTISAKLARLKGVPVVVNQWASWCTNCRAEFPFFQQAGRQYAGRVGFVGLDSQDSRSNAEAFLRQFPVDYPSVFDASASQAQSLGGGQGWPTTIFFNSAHQITNVHVGAYPTLQSLEQDIAAYS
jgi:thiol-disulfide isomerase/thioredoxin